MRLNGLSKILFIVSFLTILLSGCATVAPPAPGTVVAWKDRQAALARLQSWQLSGKIAVQTAQDSGSATIDWTQHAGQYSISLLGPLGSGGFKLSGNPREVTVITAEGKQFHAASPEQLLAQTWGFHLPVSYLNYWIRGLPAPVPIANTQYDAYGRLSELKQQGWSIRFQSYTHAGNLDLPSRLAMTSPELNIKMVIYQWQVE